MKNPVKILDHIFDPSRKLLKHSKKIAHEVFKLEAEMKNLKDEDFPKITNELKEKVKNGATLDDILVKAYALVREASTRKLGLTPYFCQVQGGYIIHGGNIAEMKTGEGKTLTAVMPAYLNALSGNGVHIVTVNEYLAGREANGEIGELFRFLGLTVGLNLNSMTSDEKRKAYWCDILYSTNSELGFDYLRDHMVLYKEDMVQQRGLNYAIIDEVDSILIDEARTPLIISGGQKQDQHLYIAADRFVKSLEDEDYEIDIETKSIELLESGVIKAQNFFKLENLYDLANVNLVHRINNALRANFIMNVDKDYVVHDNKILIVDQFTGRILDGRQFSEGLHQAIEAKENVEIKKETITVATITYQNFFRMYKKLAGMTGTAKTEEEEFKEIYNMLVVAIPTNKPVIRIDAPDVMYAHSKDKYEALVNEVVERHKKGQPLLVGTVAVETSEMLSNMLYRRGIQHEVLNAKNHAREAEIIAKAGQKGSVTIATNMAGRGTDIKLGEGVVELGGLAVLGSERHEARRIDNQLRGRSGRQGDPGYSKFFISAEDDLTERFGGQKFRQKIEFIEKLNNSDRVKEGNNNTVIPLESKMFSKFIASAQKKVEGNNYDARKHVLKYDDVNRKQRELIYNERTEVLKLDDIEPQVIQVVEEWIDQVVENFVTKTKGKLNTKELFTFLDGNIFKTNQINFDHLKQLQTLDQIYDYLVEIVKKEVENKRSLVDPEQFREFLKVIMLRSIDTYWTQHIDTMQGLRQAVGLHGYGQQDPFVSYQKHGKELFEQMIFNIGQDLTKYLIRSIIQKNEEREEVVKNTAAQTPVEKTEFKDYNKKPAPGQAKKPWQ